MTERYGRSNQPDAERGWDQGRTSPRQQQQFHDSDYRQAGGYDDTMRNRGWESQQGGAYSGYSGSDDDYGYRSRRDDDRYGSSGFGRSQYGGQGFGRERYGRDDYDRGYTPREQRGGYAQQSGYGSHRDTHVGGHGGGYGSAHGGYGASSDSFQSFTGNDYGGRDFTRGSNALYGGSYGTSYGRPSDRNDYGDWRHYGESRGFLERAGDEIASWFGDEDAARRRREDHRGRGPEGYTRSDERIREDVNDALTRDWAVDASRITVKVQNGEVTLDGTVPSRTAKRKAEDCVDEISGVKHVQNNLRVQDHSMTGTTGMSGTTGTSGMTATSTGSTTTGVTSDTTRTSR